MLIPFPPKPLRLMKLLPRPLHTICQQICRVLQDSPCLKPREPPGGRLSLQGTSKLHSVQWVLLSHTWASLVIWGRGMLEVSCRFPTFTPRTHKHAHPSGGIHKLLLWNSQLPLHPRTESKARAEEGWGLSPACFLIHAVDLYQILL